MADIFNNAQFRTQAWESDLQLQSDRFRMQGQQSGLGMLNSMAQHSSRMRQQNSQFQQDYAMRREAMVGQQQMQQRDMKMREANTAMRMQLMEQERQENAYKLQSMQAIDAAKRSRAEYESMELANERMRLQLEMDRKKFEGMDQDGYSQQMSRVMDSTGGLDALADSDIVMDLSPEGLPVLKFDEKRAKEIRGRRGYGSGGSGGRGDPLQDAQKYRLMADHIADRYRPFQGMPPDWSGEGGEEARRQHDFFENLMLRAGGLPQELIGGQRPPGGGGGAGGGDRRQSSAPTEPAARVPVGNGQPDIEMSEAAMDQYVRAADFASRDPALSQMAGEMGDQGFQRFLAGVSAFSADLVESGRTTPDMAYQVALGEVMRGSATGAFVLRASGMSDSQVRSWLRARGATEGAIENFMRQVDEYAKRRSQE